MRHLFFSIRVLTDEYEENVIMLNLFNYIIITQGTDICNRDDSAKIKYLRFS